jgi:glutathione synthase
VGNKIGKFLMQHGINFCGIDMIGEYLTEVNITSPTGAREIFEFGGENPIKALLENL